MNQASPPGDPFAGKHLFIVGSGRSGTTLLSSIVFDSEEFARYHAESNILLLRPIYGNIEKPANRERFLADWYNSRQFHRSGMDKATFEKILDDSGNDYCGILARLMGTISANQQRPRWIENTPGFALHLQELAKRFPQSLFIHMARDPRAVASSLRKLGWTVTRSGDPMKQLRYCCAKINQTVDAVRAAKPTLGSRLLEVRYEDLASDAAGTLARVSDFVGATLAEVPSDDNPYSSINQSNTAFGEQLNGISDKAVNRWRSQLTAEEIAVVSQLCEKVIKDYNYDLPENPSPSPWRLPLEAWHLQLQDGLKHHTVLGRIATTPLELGKD